MAATVIANNNVWIFRSAAQSLDKSFVALLHHLLGGFGVIYLNGQQHLLEPVHSMLQRAHRERMPHIPMFMFWIMFKFSNGVRETCQKQLAACGADTSRFDTLVEFVSASVLTLLRSHESQDHSSLVALSSMVGPAVVRHDYDYMATCTQKMLTVVLADAAHVRSIASERTRSNKKAASDDDYNNLVKEFARAIDLNAVATERFDESDPDMLSDSATDSSPSSPYESDSESQYDSETDDYTSGAESPLPVDVNVGLDELASLVPGLSTFTI
jgi:hypothetical protein